MMGADPGRIAADALARLETAWNAGDGSGYAAPFAEDCDFVDIRGEHHHGRLAVSGGHQAIFDSLYRGSRIRYTLESARPIRQGVILAPGAAILNAPSGPLAGEHSSTLSLLLLESDRTWQIASFHNTLVYRPG
jgi:uncharacterized protein (TIGR02246 family)